MEMSGQLMPRLSSARPSDYFNLYVYLCKFMPIYRHILWLIELRDYPLIDTLDKSEKRNVSPETPK